MLFCLYYLHAQSVNLYSFITTTTFFSHFTVNSPTFVVFCPSPLAVILLKTIVFIVVC